MNIKHLIILFLIPAFSYQYGKSWNELMHADEGSVKPDNVSERLTHLLNFIDLF